MKMFGCKCKPRAVSKSFRTREITELIFSHILNMNRGTLHIRRFTLKHLFGYRFLKLKNGFAPEKFPATSRNGPRGG